MLFIGCFCHARPVPLPRIFTLTLVTDLKKYPKFPFGVDQIFNTTTTVQKLYMSFSPILKCTAYKY